MVKHGNCPWQLQLSSYYCLRCVTVNDHYILPQFFSEPTFSALSQPTFSKLWGSTNRRIGYKSISVRDKTAIFVPKWVSGSDNLRLSFILSSCCHVNENWAFEHKIGYKSACVWDKSYSCTKPGIFGVAQFSDVIQICPIPDWQKFSHFVKKFSVCRTRESDHHADCWTFVTCSNLRLICWICVQCCVIRKRTQSRCSTHILILFSSDADH